MCRRNHLHGFCAAAFGLGLIVGSCIESGFWCFALGVGAILFGFAIAQKK